MGRTFSLIIFAFFFSNSNASELCETLYRASELGEYNTVTEIVSSNLSVTSCAGKWGYTPLHGVVSGHGVLVKGDLDIINYLIKNGANVEAKADGGITPLHITPYPEVVDLLVKRGANLDATDDDGSTAIMFSVEDNNGSAALLKLLELGANVNHRNKRGQSALDIAYSREEQDKVKILKKYGAK
ncbi:ankyrin repeat domain-containing protein [uncultured Gilvimarinus sp.]|uniref:ankyrin repeat domain-containing protein n=1 Tax=uncultured Gilvimarinus sp. TaxID=1689143 RepID=UPI0030DB09F1